MIEMDERVHERLAGPARQRVVVGQQIASSGTTAFHHTAHKRHCASGTVCRCLSVCVKQLIPGQQKFLFRLIACRLVGNKSAGAVLSAGYYPIRLLDTNSITASRLSPRTQLAVSLGNVRCC